MEKHLFGNTCMRLESFLFSFTGSVRRAPASHCDFISFHFAKFLFTFSRADIVPSFLFCFSCNMWKVIFHLIFIAVDCSLLYTSRTHREGTNCINIQLHDALYTHCTHATKHYNQIIYRFNMLITNGFHIIFFRELPWRFVCRLTFNSALLLFFMIHIPCRSYPTDFHPLYAINFLLDLFISFCFCAFFAGRFVDRGGWWP